MIEATLSLIDTAVLIASLNDFLSLMHYEWGGAEPGFTLPCVSISRSQKNIIIQSGFCFCCDSPSPPLSLLLLWAS